MKTALSLLAAAFAVISAPAQTPPGAISRSPTESIAPIETNRFGLGNLYFTNRSGAVYSADQLAAQLQNLRSAVDQALPVLTAFSENFSNANSSQTLTGTLSGLLSGVLNRSANQSTNASGQTSSQLTNLVAGLQRLLTTNATGSVSINANTVRDLVALQSQLRSVESTLQSLNVGGSFTNLPGVLSERLTPTGR
jgi:hypothetical protein